MESVFGISFIMLWLIILVVMLVIEIATLGLTTIWFAGGALVSFVLALFGTPLIIQIAAFIVVSLVLLFFTRPVAVKYFNKDREKTNIEGMIGKQAIVVIEVNNLEGSGRVIVSGQEWSALSSRDSVKIPVGAVTVIKDVKGVKLIVEEES